MKELVKNNDGNIVCSECGEVLEKPTISHIIEHYQHKHPEVYADKFKAFVDNHDFPLNALFKKRWLSDPKCLNMWQIFRCGSNFLPTKQRWLFDFNMPSMVEQVKTSTMNITDTVERMCYEGKTVGYRCRLCGKQVANGDFPDRIVIGFTKLHYDKKHPEIAVDYTIAGIDMLAHEVDNGKRPNLFLDLDEMEIVRLNSESNGYHTYTFGNSKHDAPLIISSPMNAEFALGLMQDTLHESTTEWRWIDTQIELARVQFRETDQKIHDQFTRLHNNWINENLEVMSNENEELEDERRTRISDNPYDGATMYAELRRQIISEDGLPNDCTISNDNMVRKLLHTPRIGAELLIDMELRQANQFFPQFNTQEEGWAVLKEEIEETQEEMADILKQHQYLWDNIRFPDRFNNLSNNMIEMQRTARQLVEEAVQVAAMVQKYTDLLNRDNHQDIVSE